MTNYVEKVTDWMGKQKPPHRDGSHKTLISLLTGMSFIRRRCKIVRAKGGFRAGLKNRRPSGVGRRNCGKFTKKVDARSKKLDSTTFLC